MANAKEIARIFNYLSQSIEGRPIEKIRLNKMLYFAQGHALSELGHALFTNQIDAWEHGPVVSVVFNGFEKIIEATDELGIEDIKINPEDMEIILDVWSRYGGYKARELVDLTHQTGTPWADSYIQGKKNVHIPQDLIKRYFSKPENRLRRVTERIGELPTISELPADEYDPDEDSVWKALLNDGQ